MEFELFCNVCKQKVVGNPWSHLKDKHKMLEFFTLVPALNWEDFAEEPKEPLTPGAAALKYAGIKPKIRKPIEPAEEVEEDEE